MAGEEILIVEDNPKNMKLVRDVLEHYGYATVGATSAEEALATVAGRAPDLILMDIALPGMDGFEALKRLKADPSTERITVCALTAFAMNADRERCLSAGFDGYLVKPIDVAEFPTQVRELLDRDGEMAT
jgi:two-component system cell cycle response regulator DivK